MKFNLLAWISIAIVICNLYLLIPGRVTSMIRGIAVQGFLLSILPLLLPHSVERIHIVILFVLSAGIKGILIPRYLFKAVRGVRVLNEIRPAVGFSLSIVYGIIISALSFYALRKIPFYSVTISPFHGATAIATAFIGLFIIIVRRNVVAQIIGYLVFENASYILGLSVAASMPLFIEMGVLLDILASTFIMVIAVNYVHTKHETICGRSLESLTN